MLKILGYEVTFVVVVVDVDDKEPSCPAGHTPSVDPSCHELDRTDLCALPPVMLSQTCENQHKVVDKAHEHRILEKAQIIEAKHRRTGELSTALLPRECRRKSHCDLVLEEITWFANDFAQGLLWKMTAAHNLANAVMAFWYSAKLLAKNLNGSESEKCVNDEKTDELLSSENKDGCPDKSTCFVPPPVHTEVHERPDVESDICLPEYSQQDQFTEEPSCPARHTPSVDPSCITAELSTGLLPREYRRKSHYDLVLEEITWFANDFAQERLWKITAAHNLANAVMAFWYSAKLLAKNVNGSESEKCVNDEKTYELLSSENKDGCPDKDKVTKEKLQSHEPKQKPAIGYDAISFLQSTCFVAPPFHTEVHERPDVRSDICLPEYSQQDQFTEENLMYVVPFGGTETCRKSIESCLIDAEIIEEGFSVAKFPEYGKLSKFSGELVSVDSRMQHPADFALWKEPSCPAGHTPSVDPSCNELDRTDLCAPPPIMLPQTSENQHKLVDKAHEGRILEEAQIIEAKHRRIAELSTGLLPREYRRKSHWDVVLEEMTWFANDFAQKIDRIMSD